MAGFGLLLPSSAAADPWENVSIGARTGAMGGAAIAGGSDSAMPTLNPAGLARVPGSLISLSASVYELSTVTVPNYVADGDVVPSANGDLSISQAGIQSREFGAFPAGFAYFLHMGTEARPMVFAGSVSVPRQINRRVVQNLEFLGDNVAIRSNLTTVVRESTYHLATSWGMGLGDLKLGVSVLGAYTSSLKSNEVSDLTVLGTARFVREQTKSVRSVGSFDLGLVAGIQYDLFDGFRLGLSLRSPSLHLTGSAKGAVDVTYVDETENSVSTTFFDGDGTRGFPLRVGIGAEAYGESWAVALDARVFVPRSDEYKSSGTLLTSSLGGNSGAAPDRERVLDIVESTNVTFDLALGLEWWLDPENSIRAGVFTQMSASNSSEDVVAERMGARALPEDFFNFPIDRFGASLGWGTRLGPADTTVGFRASFGSGDTLRKVPQRRFDTLAPAEATTATAFDIQAFLSAAVDISEAAKAIAGDAP